MINTPAREDDQGQWFAIKAAFNDCTGVVTDLRVWRDEHAASTAAREGLGFARWMRENYPELHPVTEITTALPTYPLDGPFRIHNGVICDVDDQRVDLPPIVLDMDRPDNPVDAYPLWLHDPTQPHFSPIDGLPVSDGIYIISAPRFICGDGDHDCYDDEHPTSGVLAVLRAED